MRLDKFLKVSRLIKRRSVANEVCSTGRVMLNDKVAKPSSEIKMGDKLTISFGSGDTTVEVLEISETVRKEQAANLYKIL